MTKNNETMPDETYFIKRQSNYCGVEFLSASNVTEQPTGTIAYIRKSLVSAAVREAEDYAGMIRLLLPLAKGYVHANPGIRSTECIIEDAEAMLEQTNTTLAALRGFGE